MTEAKEEKQHDLRIQETDILPQPLQTRPNKPKLIRPIGHLIEATGTIHFQTGIVGGMPDMIQNQVNGILVEPDQAAQLASAISLLLNNPLLRQKFSKNGNSVLERRYYANRVTLAMALKDSVRKYFSERI